MSTCAEDTATADRFVGVGSLGPAQAAAVIPPAQSATNPPKLNTGVSRLQHLVVTSITFLPVNRISPYLTNPNTSTAAITLEGE